MSQLPSESASSEGWSRLEQLVGLQTELTHVVASGKQIKAAEPLKVLPRPKRKAVRPGEVARQLERG